MAGLFAVAWIAWPWLPVAPQATGLAKLTMIALFVVIVVSFSPTMTAAVISETGARGHLSDLVLAMVVLADVVVLVALLAVDAGRALHSRSTADANDVNVLVRLAWEIGGAVAFGSLVGALFALYLRYVAREITIVLIAVCAVLSQVGAAQRFEPLLAAMAAGLVIENFAVAQGDALKMALQRGALPVLVVFFVAVGTSLRLDALVTMGVVATGLVALRIALIRLGLAVGLRVSDVDRRTGAYAWTGLISQAGITLGLASVLATEFPTWGGQVQILLVALIAIDELVGPTVFRIGLAYAGEIDASAPRPLVVVSNREPYLHNYDNDGEIVCAPATGGVAVALDALMRERSGVWIAHGAGTADRALVDATDRVRVPPDTLAYQLRRLWLDPDEFAAYYGGFANEGLWPLCHLVDVRPKFRSEDWEAYQTVNARFAAAIEQELPTARRLSSSRTTIWRSSRRDSANGGPPRTRRSSGTSRGRIPIDCGSVPGGGSSSRACWRTTCWRSSWNAIDAISCSRWKTSSTPRLKPTGRVFGSPAAPPASSRCRSVSTTTGSRRWAATERSRRSSSV